MMGGMSMEGHVMQSPAKLLDDMNGMDLSRMSYAAPTPKAEAVPMDHSTMSVADKPMVGMDYTKITESGTSIAGLNHSAMTNAKD